MQKKAKHSELRSALLIEDCLEVREFIYEFLSLEGYSVVSSNSGGRGWRFIRDAEFDLVIMDIGLPEIDGIELLRKMRENNIMTPVLLISGVSLNKVWICNNLPACAIVHKPFNLREIKTAINGLLNFNYYVNQE